MVDAIKCDRCGMLEEKYYDKNGKYIATPHDLGSTKHDLCSVCKESFKRWWDKA